MCRGAPPVITVTIIVIIIILLAMSVIMRWMLTMINHHKSLPTSRLANTHTHTHEEGGGGRKEEGGGRRKEEGGRRRKEEGGRTMLTVRTMETMKAIWTERTRLTVKTTERDCEDD